MKWSELFANILGEKDVDVVSSSSQNLNSQIQNNSQAKDSPGSNKDTGHVTSNSPSSQSQQNSGIQKTTAPNLTQEQFDVLNAKITELEKANRELVLNGVSENQTPEATPESLIYSLCVERGRYGNKNTENSSITTER